MWEALGFALGWVLLLEGLLPFLSPARWRAVFERLLLLSDGQLRFVGLSSIAIGLRTLYALT